VRTHVAVVGAGAIGLAVALQLRRSGVADIVVVDRHSSPGMGSTGRANGGVRAQFSTQVNILFSRYTIAGLIELDRLTNGRVGYRPVGYLVMAGTDLTAEALRDGYETQLALDVPVEWLSVAQTVALAPFVRVEGLRASTYCASDGVIDPHGVVSALRSEGARLGVTYLFDVDVVGLEHSNDHTVVRCTGMDIETEYVVNAAGPSACDLAATAGVELPVVPYRRNLACTEPVSTLPTSIPMCVDTDTGVLIRREGSGVLIGYSDPASPPSWDSSFEPEFLDAIATRVGNRFPFLEQATMNPRKCWAGLYPETPDHNAIIDASADAPWFIQCVGFGGHGIMHCLAAGQAVAELVRDQRCSTFDLEPLRLDRFGESALTMETAIL
jgi:glycine/D-amino acid oxidase-like deaminating enzyme